MNIKLIIRIQAQIRRYNVLNRIRSIKSVDPTCHNYFTRAEILETLRPISLNRNDLYFFIKEKPITHPLYVYFSGATYEGTWKGGFRHGVGKQIWKDLTSYKG